jgi:hypothetical protein
MLDEWLGAPGVAAGTPRAVSRSTVMFDDGDV